MSGIAEVMHNLGYRVQGSDMAVNANVRRLQELGVDVSIGHEGGNVGCAAAVVISSAVPADNIEVQVARTRGLPLVARSEMLAELMRMKTCIAVGGTHGKTTTTSMISALLDVAEMDPTVINGGIINAYGTNARLGGGDWMVVEADESDGSFIKVPPTYAVITNVDREHMDYYKSMDKLKNHFLEFINKVPSFGKSFICIDDQVNNEIIRKIKKKNFYTYGINKNSNFRIKNIQLTYNFDDTILY